MTDKSRIERRLIASIRQVKTEDEALPDRQSAPGPQPVSSPSKTPAEAKAEPAAQNMSYQSPGRVWPD